MGGDAQDEGDHSDVNLAKGSDDNHDSADVSEPRSFLGAFGHLRHDPIFASTFSSTEMSLSVERNSGASLVAETRGPRRHIATALAHARAKTMMLASTRQRGNPMLKHVRHVSVAFDNDIVPDFVCGATTAVLFLSLQYHSLHPDYIYMRVRALGKAYKLRVLMVLIDVDDHRHAVQELTKLSIINELTLVCVTSEREAARYCETLRSYNSKTADSIQEQIREDYGSRISAALSSVRGINRTDVATLAFTFGSLKSLSTASEEQLRQCPGMGERKVARLYAALNQPFAVEEPWRKPSGDVDEGDD